MKYIAAYSGTKKQKRIPYIQEGNGIVERRNRTVMKGVLSVMHTEKFD